MVQSNLPPNESQDPVAGPITLGQSANGIVLGPPRTPPRHLDGSNHSTLTNGIISDLDKVPGQSTSNGATNDSTEDVHMANSEQTTSAGNQETQSSVGPSAQTRPLHLHTGAPASLHQRLSHPGSLSQRSAITPMAEGSNAAMYENLASSTSSEKRLTGETGGTGETARLNGELQPSNGVSQVGDDSLADQSRISGALELSMIMGEVPSNSQMPSTQGTSDRPRTGRVSEADFSADRAPALVARLAAGLDAAQQRQQPGARPKHQQGVFLG